MNTLENTSENAKNENFGWYLLSCPVRREESIAKKIEDEIAAKYSKVMGPIIAPSVTSSETVEGKIKMRVKHLRGFLILRVLVATNSYGELAPDKNLFTLLRAISGVNIMYDKPLSQEEVDKMIAKSTKDNIDDSQKQMNSLGERLQIVDGPFRGIVGRLIKRSISEKYDILASISLFNREIEVPLLLQEVKMSHE